MNIYEDYPFNILQEYPIANISHILLGILICYNINLIWVIIIYTLLKLIYKKDENIMKRVPSLIEVLLGIILGNMIEI